MFLNYIPLLVMVFGTFAKQTPPTTGYDGNVTEVFYTLQYLVQPFTPEIHAVGNKSVLFLSIVSPQQPGEMFAVIRQFFAVFFPL